MTIRIAHEHHATSCKERSRHTGSGNQACFLEAGRLASIFNLIPHRLIFLLFFRVKGLNPHLKWTKWTKEPVAQLILQSPYKAATALPPALRKWTRHVELTCSHGSQLHKQWFLWALLSPFAFRGFMWASHFVSCYELSTVSECVDRLLGRLKNYK